MKSSEKFQKAESEQPDINIENQVYVRKRTRASAEQLSVLEDTFSVNVSPNSKLRKKLAEQLQMSERSIQIWFQNRGAKVKHMQKRAQMQMQQAAIRAQLYYFQQQQYEMLPQYSTAPLMIPNQPAPCHNYQQPPCFPPSQTRTVPLTRAKSADALSYYRNNPLPAYDRQSSVPNLAPEPLVNSNVASSTINMYQHDSPIFSSKSWSVFPNPTFMESPVEITRQSMPPYDSFPLQAYQDNNIPNTHHAEFDTYVNIEKQTIQYGSPLNTNDGQISLSPSPIEDSSSNSSSVTDNGSQNRNGSSQDLPNSSIDLQTIHKATDVVPATDIWVSSPVKEQWELVDVHISNTTNTRYSSVNTVNPFNLTMANFDSLDKEYSKYQLFNASTLTIGSWHRVKVQTSDLMCIYYPNKNAFEWLITERERRFKVVILRSNISTIEHSLMNATSADEADAEVHFYLSHPPLFYMKSITNGAESQWIQCSDFTENEQASRYLRHTWKGSSQQMKKDINEFINKHNNFKDKIYFLDSSSQNQLNFVALNGLCVSSQQQQNITDIPFVSYNPYYNHYSDASPMLLSISSNEDFCSSIDSSSSFMITPNKVTCSSFYS